MYKIIAVTDDADFIPLLQLNDSGYGKVVTALLLGSVQVITGILRDYHYTMASWTIDVLRRRGGDADYQALAEILVSACNQNKLYLTMYDVKFQRSYAFHDAAALYFSAIAHHDGEVGLSMLMDLACGEYGDEFPGYMRMILIGIIGKSDRQDAIPQIKAEIARLKAAGGEENLQFLTYWETALNTLNGNPCAGVDPAGYPGDGCY